MNFLCARVAQHGYYTVNRCAAHYAVVDHNDAFSLNHVGNRVELYAHAFHSFGLAGLYKGSADVGILYDCLFVGNPRFLRVAYRCVNSRFGHADNHVGFNGTGAGKYASRLLSGFVNTDAVDH